MSFNPEDAPALGHAIYHEKIHPTLGPECKGKVAAFRLDRIRIAAVGGKAVGGRRQ